MNDLPLTETVSPDDQLTGLPWPKTWNGAYIFVVCHFAFWIVLLVVLREYCQ